MAFTILFQGDSITDCGRMTCGGAGYATNLGPGYPAHIAGRLLCDAPEKDWNFINLGISGHRIVDLYARWKRDALNLKPDLISILCGVNDTWHEVDNHNGVEVPRYERIYREILQWSRDVLPNVKFLLMDPFVCPGMPGRAEFVPEITERQAVVTKLAAEFGAAHLETQKLFDAAFKRAPESFWSPDGVHPTLAGHQLIADEWLKVAAPLLP